MEFLLLAIPVVFCVASVLVCSLAVKKGAKTKKTLAVQILSFCAVFIGCLLIPTVAGAADTETTAQVAQAGSNGLGLIAVALSTGLACLGAGIAVAGAAPAAIGATSEDPKAFGKSLIFVALGEGVAIYGLLISILILGNV